MVDAANCVIDCNARY